MKKSLFIITGIFAFIGAFLPIVITKTGIYTNIGLMKNSILYILYVIPLFIAAFGIVQLYGKSFKFFHEWLIILSAFGIGLVLYAENEGVKELKFSSHLMNFISGSGHAHNYIVIDGKGSLIMFGAYLATIIFALSFGVFLKLHQKTKKIKQGE